MDFTWMLVILFVKTGSSVTLEEIAESLQNVQTMLRNETECEYECRVIENIKPQLQNYIDVKLNDYVDNKFKLYIDYLTKDNFALEIQRQVEAQMRKNVFTNSIVHAFASEKKMRKEMEYEIHKTYKSLSENEVDLNDVKEDILKLKINKDEINQMIKSIRNEVRLLNSRMVDHAIIDEWKSKMNDVCGKAEETITESVSIQLDEFKTELKETVENYNIPDIAFAARIEGGQSYDDIKPWQTIVFGDVSLNVGQAYSGKTGEFTAPVNGIYFFHVHIAGGHNRALEIVMRKNTSKEKLLLLYVNGPGVGTDGGDIVTQLDKGDVVKVEKHGAWGTRPFFL